MKNGGVIPHHDIHVTGKDTTVLHVSIVSHDKHEPEPEWAEVTFKVEHVSAIKVTPLGQNGKPTGEPHTTHVAHTTTTTTVVVHFTTTTKAATLKVELTQSSTATVKADVTSAKACLPKNGVFLIYLLKIDIYYYNL